MKTSYRHSMNLLNQPFWYTGQNISFNSNYKIQKYFLPTCCKSSFIGLLWITSKQIDYFLVFFWALRSLAELLAVLISRPCPLLPDGNFCPWNLWGLISVTLIFICQSENCSRMFLCSNPGYLSFQSGFWHNADSGLCLWCIDHFHCDVGRSLLIFYIYLFPYEDNCF